MARHLGDLVSAYVDRRLPASVLGGWDRHLVACQHCRYAVEQERRLLASLRSAPDPGVSPSLHQLLVALASLTPGPDPDTDRAAHPRPSVLDMSRAGMPLVPLAPTPVDSSRGMRLPTVAPAAPALHRSVRRFAALAGLAAGASAAAAWAVGVAPATSTAALTPPQVTRPAPPGGTTFGALVVGNAVPNTGGSRGVVNARTVLFERPAP